MDEQRQLLFVSQFLPSSEQKLIDRLRDGATRRVTRPPEVTTALSEVPIDSISEIVVGPNHVGVLRSDGTINRLPYVSTSRPLAPSASPAKNAADGSAAAGGAANARAAKFRRYENVARMMVAGGRNHHGVIIDRAARPLLPASSVPEEMIAQAQVVLQGKSREVIVRELQRTNLNVNEAVNNLLTRDDDDDGDDGSEDAEMREPAGILQLLENDLRDFEHLLPNRDRERGRGKSEKGKDKDKSEGLRRYEIPSGSIAEPWEGSENKDAVFGNIRFSRIAATQSEIFAISIEGKLYGWKWTESAGGSEPHPMHDKLGLEENEYITHITACSLRVAVLTSSGRIATWLDTVACGERLSEALFVPPQKMTTTDVVEQLVVSNQIAVARCANNVFYWCGLYPVNDRRRIFEKTRSRQRKHVTFDTTQIVEGSEVRTKSEPIYSIGCIAANLTSHPPMMGILMEHAWSLSEVCRFRLLDPAVYDQDKYDPTKGAAEATVDETESREAAVAQQALTSGNRKRAAADDVFGEGSPKLREEAWPISDVIFIHEEVSDTATVTIVDGGYCAVEYKPAPASPTDAYATPASKQLASKEKPPKKQRLIRKDELAVVSQKTKYARSPMSTRIEPQRFVLSGSTSAKRVISAVADSLGIRALVERAGVASIVRMSVCGKTLTSHTLPLHAPSLHAMVEDEQRWQAPSLMNYGDDGILLIRDGNGGIIPLVRDAAGGFREPSYLQLPATKVTGLAVKSVKDKDRPSWAAKANREAVIISLQGANQDTTNRRLPSLLHTVMCCDEKAVKALLDALQSDEDFTLNHREIVESWADGNRNILHAAVMNAFATKNALEADVESVHGPLDSVWDEVERRAASASASTTSTAVEIAPSGAAPSTSATTNSTQDSVFGEMALAPMAGASVTIKMEEMDENALRVTPSPVENPRQRQDNAIAIVKMLVSHPICMPYLTKLLSARDIHGQTPFMAAVNHRAYSAARFIFNAIESLFVLREDGVFPDLSVELLPFIFPAGCRPDDSPLFVLCSNDTCSFTWTGVEHAHQDIYECRTCGITGTICCCTECAQSCHRGHDCKLKRTSPTAYCDCWEKACCKALVSGNQEARKALLNQLIGKSKLYEMLNGRGEHILLYLARKLARQSTEQLNYRNRPRGLQARASSRDLPEHDLEPPRFAKFALKFCVNNWLIVRSLAMSGVREMNHSLPMAEEVFHLNAQHGSSHLDKFMLMLLTKCSDDSENCLRTLLVVLTEFHNRARSQNEETLKEVNFVISRFVRSVARLFILAVVISGVAASTAVSGLAPAKEASASADRPQILRGIVTFSSIFGQMRKDPSRDSKLKNMGMFIMRCKVFFEHFAVFTLHEMAQLADASLAPVRTGILRPCVSLAAVLGTAADNIESLEKYINSEPDMMAKLMNKHDERGEERIKKKKKKRSRRDTDEAASERSHGAGGGGGSSTGAAGGEEEESSESDSDGDGPSSRRHTSQSEAVAANEERRAPRESDSSDDDDELDSDDSEDDEDEEEEDDLLDRARDEGEEDEEMDYATSEGDVSTSAAGGEENNRGEGEEEERRRERDEERRARRRARLADEALDQILRGRDVPRMPHLLDRSSSEDEEQPQQPLPRGRGRPTRRIRPAADADAAAPAAPAVNAGEAATAPAAPAPARMQARRNVPARRIVLEDEVADEDDEEAPVLGMQARRDPPSDEDLDDDEREERRLREEREEEEERNEAMDDDDVAVEILDDDDVAEVQEVAAAGGAAAGAGAAEAAAAPDEIDIDLELLPPPRAAPQVARRGGMAPSLTRGGRQLSFGRPTPRVPAANADAPRPENPPPVRRQTARRGGFRSETARGLFVPPWGDQSRRTSWGERPRTGVSATAASTGGSGSPSGGRSAEAALKDDETPTTHKAGVQLAAAFSFAVRVIVDLLPIVASGSSPALDSPPTASYRDVMQLNAMEDDVRRRAIDHVGTRLEESWRWLALVLDHAEAQIKYINAVSSTEDAKKKESKEKKRGQRWKSPLGSPATTATTAGGVVTPVTPSTSGGAPLATSPKVKRETIACLLGVLRAHSGEAGDDTPRVDLETLRAPALVVDAYLSFLESKADAEKLFELSKKKDAVVIDQSGVKPERKEEEIVGVRRFYQRSNSVSFPGASFTDAHDTLQLSCMQALPIVERPQLLTSTVEKEVIFGPPASTLERTKEEHDKVHRSHGVSHPHNLSLTAASISSHRLFVEEKKEEDVRMEVEGDHAVQPIQPIVIPAVASAPASMNGMAEEAEKREKKAPKKKRGKKRGRAGEAKQQQQSSSQEDVVMADDDSQPSGDTSSSTAVVPAVPPAGFEQVTYEEILETFNKFHENPLRKLMGRWRFALQLIVNELHGDLTATLGGEFAGSTLLREVAGFAMRQRALRLRMGKYNATATKDLSIEVHRDPAKLIKETCIALNMEFAKRQEKKTTVRTPRAAGVDTKKDEPLPVLASHKVKVKFVDEPGEGTGVARSYFTALAEALTTLPEMPFEVCDHSYASKEAEYAPVLPAGSPSAQRARIVVLRGGGSRDYLLVPLPTFTGRGHTMTGGLMPSPFARRNAFYFDHAPYTPADMAAAEALDVTLDALRELNEETFPKENEDDEELQPELADRLFMLIRAMYPTAAARITGMLMACSWAHLSLILAEPNALILYVGDAIDMLNGRAQPADLELLRQEAAKNERDAAPLFFRPSKNAHYSPVPGRLSTARMMAFRNVGRVIGLCLMQCEMFPLRLSRHVLKYILGRPLNWHDFAFYDPQMFESLRKLIVDGCSTPDHRQFFDDLQMTFSIDMPLEATGMPSTTLDLIPGGSEILVTKDNIIEYVYRFVEARLLGSTNGKCLAAMRQGVHDVIPQSMLDNITAEDLRLLLCGTETVSLSLMQSYTAWTDESHAAPETIAKFKQWFWQVAERLSPEEKQDLIFFWTGSPSLPSTEEGFLPSPTIVIRPADDSFLPTANTCISRLYLPLYNSKKTLTAKLQLAIKAKNFGFV